MQDPRQRLSIQQVMQHEWFQTGLPPGAASLNDQALQQQVGQLLVAGLLGRQAVLLHEPLPP